MFSGTSHPAANANNPAYLDGGQATTLSQQMDQQRAIAMQAIVTTVTNRMNTLDTNASPEKYSPVVYGKLTPQVIQQVAVWNEVDRDRSLMEESNCSVALPTPRSPTGTFFTIPTSQNNVWSC